MNFNGWNNFEDLAKACGYTISNKDNDSTKNNFNSNSSSNNTNSSSNIGCNDIPNGFQSLNPELFIIIGEILGNIIAGSTPFNVQNALGNWLQLVGQAILTYNAQQQYFQIGPGRYFSPENYNINNPFCTTTSTNTSQNSTSSNDNKNSSKKKEISNSSSKSNYDDTDKIKILESRINELTKEIDEIRNLLEK